MLITSFAIQNFRKLYRCRIDISNQTTLFVGANNSGKTSAMDALCKFLTSRNFVFNDITTLHYLIARKLIILVINGLIQNANSQLIL